MLTKFEVYEYPTKDCVGSYTIKASVKSLGFKGEVKVDSFEVDIPEKKIERELLK